jgi:hypothetical protein
VTSHFLYGMLVALCFTASVFFFRFWHRTRDRLFAWFGLGFAVLAANWIGLALTNVEEESRTYFYVIRLIAFVLIMVGIIDKNRSAAKP